MLSIDCLFRKKKTEKDKDKLPEGISEGKVKASDINQEWTEEDTENVRYVLGYPKTDVYVKAYERLTGRKIL